MSVTVPIDFEYNAAWKLRRSIRLYWLGGVSEIFMKKPNSNHNDMRPEYDFTNMKGRVRGKYAKLYRAGTNLVSVRNTRAVPGFGSKGSR